MEVVIKFLARFKEKFDTVVAVVGVAAVATARTVTGVMNYGGTFYAPKNSIGEHPQLCAYLILLAATLVSAATVIAVAASPAPTSSSSSAASPAAPSLLAGLSLRSVLLFLLNEVLKAESYAVVVGLHWVGCG